MKYSSILLLPLFYLSLVSCGSNAAEKTESKGGPKLVILSSLLESPWGMAFLPDGRILVTQKKGTMVIVSADGLRIEEQISGLPPVAFGGQGGLLDVVLDPAFAPPQNTWIYWTYSEPGEDGKSGTAVARGRLKGSAISNIEVIFRQTPKVNGKAHFGSRIVFDTDGTLLVTLGERGQDSPSEPDTRFAQNLSTHLGKIVRIRPDGSIPPDNPFIDTKGALPEIWSYGHRNPQGIDIHPSTGKLWSTEHGPQGGDELNLIEKGGNYGWPIKSYGCPYGSVPGSACRVGGGRHRPDYLEPASYWVPTSIAPSGLIFYNGDKFPEWKGNAFISALAGRALWRVVLEGEKEISREELFKDLGERIRYLQQGPDGWIYMITDSGKLMRVER